LGATPVEVPVLEILPPLSSGPLDAALHQLHQYQWLILTSTNTVRVLAERADALGIDLTDLSSLKVAAVGEATAASARNAGFHITFVPESYVAESLSGQTSGQKVLLVRAAIARDVIPDALRAAGATVNVADAYRNQMPASAPQLLRNAIAEGIDAATFTSSSSVTHLAEAAKVAGVPWPFPSIPAISIGPITSRTLRELGWEPAIEANPSDIPGLIAAVTQLLQR
jgi:uroporphyrinogen-III synthase